MLLATALALSAALLNAGAALLQQQGIHLGLVSVEHTDGVRIARNLRDLAQQPRWVGLVDRPGRLPVPGGGAVLRLGGPWCSR